MIFVFTFLQGINVGLVGYFTALSSCCHPPATNQPLDQFPSQAAASTPSNYPEGNPGRETGLSWWRRPNQLLMTRHVRWVSPLSGCLTNMLPILYFIHPTHGVGARGAKGGFGHIIQDSRHKEILYLQSPYERTFILMNFFYTQNASQCV